MPDLTPGQIWTRDGRTRRIVEVGERHIRWASATDQEHEESRRSFEVWMSRAKLAQEARP